MAHARRRHRALEDLFPQIETGIEALVGRREELQARFRIPLADAPKLSVRGA